MPPSGTPGARLMLQVSNLVQAVLQRCVHPAVWDPVLVTVLLLPLWLTLAVPGLLLALKDRTLQSSVT